MLKCFCVDWSIIGSMHHERLGHLASLLKDGHVLVAGGMLSSGMALATAELYNPSKGNWITISNMNNPHFYYTASLLEN